MIKQILNSVIEKYRDLLLSRSLINYSIASMRKEQQGKTIALRRIRLKLVIQLSLCVLHIF